MDYYSPVHWFAAWLSV